ncbi:MAG: aminodeoxychorismate synthase component I [Ignavibacteria bacterium]|nr:aminodeoxychorismate synthase component I [Ignavibacteria bacterium]
MKTEIKILIDKILKNENSAFFYTPDYYKNAVSYIFENPEAIIIIRNQDEIKSGLEKIENCLENGLIGYGTAEYEAGYLFEEKLNESHRNQNDSIKICFFRKGNVKEIQSGNLKWEDFSESRKQIKNFRLNTSKGEYKNAIEKIKALIKAGDTYQVNYTVKGRFDFCGSVYELFRSVIFNQSAEYCALINSGTKIIISVSPELFFKVKNNQIFAQPMKGTVKRGKNQENDILQKQKLEESKKDRAENVMIVDLLRNDLGVISKLDSVKPESLYEIQKYESVFQMVSSVSAKLKDNRFGNIFPRIFPCGSITGAPKIRTMQIIKETEKESRGIYTGSIGILKKDEMIFNVAIRTAEIDLKSNTGEIGIGSGIVWDSNPDAEYEECLLKSNFLTKPDKEFYIFESMLIENREIFLKDLHISRLKNAAEFFLFPFNEKELHKKLQGAAKNTEEKSRYKLKIILYKFGGFQSFQEIIPKKEKRNWKAVISESRINSENKFQYFKTSNRQLYDKELKKYSKMGFDEVIYFNEKEELAEGARTNIILEKDNCYFTPPVSSGILDGCYRQFLLRDKKVIEKKLYRADLDNADKIYAINSVREMIEISQIIKKIQKDIKKND